MEKGNKLHIVEKETISDDKEVLESVQSKQEEVNQEVSYEQMKTIAIQATQQTEMLQKELQRLQQESFYIRLDFLFKVVQFNKSFPPSFVNKCAKEIEGSMTIPDLKK